MGAGGTDVALETADVVLMSSDLSKLPFMMQLGRRAAQIVRQNVAFSVGVILTLVVLTILVPMVVPGFVLPLPMGVVGHEGSTLIVVLNGLRMLALRPSRLTLATGR
jgi:Cd2+/Zn2+-exporting ATPase